MPEGDVFELCALAFGDEGDEAFGVLVALVLGFDDVAVHGGAIVIAAELDGEAVPGVRIDRCFQFGEFFGLAGLRDAGLAHDPDGVLADVGACQVMMRRDVVTAAKSDMRGGAESELRGDDQIGRIELPCA